MTEQVQVYLEGVSKRFGSVQALSGVSVEFPSGAVGLLGPNGAGKSTLLRVLLGQVVPDSGLTRIAGCDPRTRAGRFGARRRVGYMPEGDCLFAGANAVEMVGSLGRVSGLSRRDSIMRSHETLDYVGLDESRYRPVDGYSTGMKQRVKLAQALVHDPPVLLLDEPTNGLDPAARRHMLALVKDLSSNQGKDVILCSHLLLDVEATCDHVVVLNAGRVLQCGRIADLTAEQDAWVQVRITGDQEAFLVGLREAGIEADPSFTSSGKAQTLRLRSHAKEGDRILAVAQAKGVVVVRLVPERSSLEEIFVGALEGDSQS